MEALLSQPQYEVIRPETMEDLASAGGRFVRLARTANLSQGQMAGAASRINKSLSTNTAF